MLELLPEPVPMLLILIPRPAPLAIVLQLIERPLLPSKMRTSALEAPFELWMLLPLISDEVRLNINIARKFEANSLFEIVTLDCEPALVELKSIPASLFPENLLLSIRTLVMFPSELN